ncbi:MAG: ABC transporter permease [Thermoleophilaceae bacterium]|nr:ABC transporter permease [Thermoleophilaceae bacterium]
MSDRRAALVVARREFGERIRQRSFRISTGVTVLLIAAVGILAGVLGGDEPKTYNVGAQGAEAAAIVRAAGAVAPGFDVRIEGRRFADAPAAREAVRAESVEVAVVEGTVVAREDPPEELTQALQAGARQVRAEALLREQGVEGPEARRVLDPPPLTVSTLEADDDGRAGIAFTASLILYGQLIVFGLAVATGVVEEKASRVVEVLLATISPRALLAGKIAGIGLLGLVQLLLLGVVGLAAASASGAIDLDGADAGALGVTLVWFLFGYALWASLYPIAGVIVSRQEDLQSSSTPLTMLLVVSYLLVFPVLDDPSSTLAVVTSIVPFCSPIVMPARVVLGDAGTLEVAASLGLLVASVALLLALGARIYEGAILRMGRPLKLTEAWRLARRSSSAST